VVLIASSQHKSDTKLWIKDVFLKLSDELKSESWYSTTSGVNFIDVLRTAFTCADTKSSKKCSQAVILFFVLLGSAHLKAACQTLVKLTPGVWVYKEAITLTRENGPFKDEK